MRRRGWAAVAAVTVVLAGLGSAVLPARAATANVSISGQKFVPATVTVNVGDTVVWTNQDPYAHTVSWPDGAPSSPNLDQGESYSRTFSAPTTLAYRCSIHSSMRGTVVVQGSAPPSTAPPTTKASTATTAKPATTTTARSGAVTTITAGASAGGINPDAYATGDSSTTTPSSTSLSTSTSAVGEELAAEDTGSSGGGAALAIFAAVALAAGLGALLWRRRGASGPAA